MEVSCLTHGQTWIFRDNHTATWATSRFLRPSELQISIYVVMLLGKASKLCHFNAWDEHDVPTSVRDPLDTVQSTDRAGVFRVSCGYI